ncbi:MAG: amino acid adenylation domain-containing protein [Cyanobacteria bacterium J06626_23]
MLDLTSEYAQINRHPLTPSPPHPLTSPLLHSPAYLIYTSGSTGTPKGVPIRHQSLTNLLTAMAQAPGMTAQDTLLAVTTPAFDIAALELFLPLTVGGTLVIASQDAVRDPQQLAAQLIQHDVTLMQATPATWRLLLASGWQGKSNLKLLCGGEALEVALAQQLLACGSELWNLYGPTETTIWSAALKIEASMLEDGIVPIGPPIANTKFYILDSQQRPVPVGVPGELHIGGLGLSPGYWRRDDLKRERFIPHPVDAFIYKTGDLVRYLENGTLQYLGRLDHQVKLRGFRIEPGEIETVLAQHPKVAQAVVVLREDTSTEPQLVAYVVRQKAERRAKNEEQRTKNELRTHLSQHLPAYMVPSQFVVLDALPLTPNGKVDRKSLPAPARTAISDDSAAPLTPTEELLANIWSTVLGQREIARDHNFFELGGHSLLATRVVAQVRQAFGVELPLRSLFEQPTLAQLAMVVDGLKRGEPVGELEAIVPVERSTPLPLSDAQQRQWVLAQLEPESPFYIIPMAVRVQGELALDWLQQSLEHVVARHEVLRTAFQDVEGKAQLEIYPQVDVSVPLMDFSDLDEVSQQERVREQIQREARTPFDLSQASLLRMQVMRLSATDHVILLSLHHIITDGWSMGILVRELAQIYDALQFKRSVELPPLPIQYVDYAVWQQRQIERQQQQLAYWQEQLQGVPPLLELPTDYPRPAVQSFEGATYEFRLSTEQTQALQALSQQQGVTLFMTLLATFQVLLYRYSGVEDLVMGTPIANRQRSELEGLIGLFVNTLVLRTDMSGNPRFEELLGRVRAMALDAYAHQSVPFEQVVDALEVPRSWSHSPLFQVMFVLQNASEAVTFEGGALDTALAWQPLPMASDTAKFDLTLSMRLDDRGLKGTLEYRTDLFTADTMHLMAGHLRQLLKVIPQQPTSRIAELPMLTKSEQKQLRQWNQTQADYPTHLCLHQLFEQQVEKTPDAIALIAANQQLSYRELNSRANQLAHYLQKHNVGPETLVGICMERTADMVVALLAILKAGGAYVPLDPAYPEERLAFILRDAQVALLLTSQALSIPVPEAIPSITVETLWNTRLAKFPTTNPTSGVSTDHLAYVIYTSGSTGKPKGVAIEHRSPVALSHWAQAVFTAEQLSGVLAGTSLCFDLSVFELFVPLSWGGTVILAENVLQLPLIAAANEVTLVNTVPSAATALLQIDGFPATVTTLNLAGEPLPPSLVQQLYQVPHIQHVFNLYGPSEDTTYSTYARMEPNTTLSPIGHPIANTQAHILDAHLQPVPVGVPGELYLSGAGVARGYLNRPELTAERFVANPFYQGTGNREQRIEQRVNGEWVIGNSTTQLPTTHYPLPTTHYPLPSTLYKTGDRVRHLPNGSLEYLGRLDNQVKVRGFRIELAEIESALLTHTAIEQAAVNPWTDDAGNQRLVAYFVKVEGRRQLVLSEIERKAEEGDKEQGTGNREQNPIQNTLREEQSSIKFKIQNSLPHHSITPQILRQHLADQLPDYMLPALFIELDELPRLPNGKLDRGALPIPEEAERTAEAIAPTTDLEAELVAIWQELLPVAQVGIHDNFFELGGDSILALQAIAKAHRLGLQLTPRDLFQHQTIARLSATVSDWEWVQAEQGLITGPVLLTPMQRWFFDQGLAYPHHWNQAILLEVQRSLNPELLEQALGLLLAHHDALRATFAQSELSSETDGQQWQQQWLEPGPVPLTVVTGDATELAEALATTTHELQTGFDLVTGPLLRVAYLDFGAEHRRLLLVSHHLVIDGLSWRILLEDLWVAYEQLEQNHSAQLPPKTTSFKQWAEHLQAYASTEALETERGYWQRLVEFSSVSLPRDFASQDNRMAIAATVTVSLSEVDTQRLLQEVPSVYQSQINDLLLTALVLALEPWTGARRLRLELEGHGREDLPSELATVNLSRTIGWFTTLFPVALDLTEALTLGAALKQVKETLRAFPNRGLGYGVLRHLASELLPLVESEVRFNYLGQVDQVLAATTGFAPASESSGAARSPHDQRTTLLEIDGLVSGGQLRLNWTYSTAIHDRATITYLANSFLDSLRQLIDYCLTTEEDAGYTPSDFPHMSLSQGELDDLLADL